MGKFYQINSELLPLICVGNWFQCTILSNLCHIFLNFVNEIIFGMSGLGSLISKFCQISSE